MLIWVGNPNEQKQIEWPVEKTKTPGVVVHKYMLCYANSVKPFKKTDGNGYWWVISHEVTGRFLVTMIPSNKMAHRLAAQLGELDWTIDPKSIKQDARYGRLVRQIKAELD